MSTQSQKFYAYVKGLTRIEACRPISFKRAGDAGIPGPCGGCDDAKRNADTLDRASRGAQSSARLAVRARPDATLVQPGARGGIAMAAAARLMASGAPPVGVP